LGCCRHWSGTGTELLFQSHQIVANFTGGLVTVLRLFRLGLANDFFESRWNTRIPRFYWVRSFMQDTVEDARFVVRGKRLWIARRWNRT
jgi:hypothetical protein